MEYVVSFRIQDRRCERDQLFDFFRLQAFEDAALPQRLKSGARLEFHDA